METMTKEKAIINLTENRDSLIKNVQRIEKMDEDMVQVYVNGVLDMYNNFVRILQQERDKETDLILTYEG
jgi:hypothetical protein